MDLESIKEKIAHLTKQLDNCNYEYYVLSQPSISDFEYDALMRELIDLEKKYPQYKNKLVFIPNGFDPEDINLTDLCKKTYKFRKIVFAGALYSGRLQTMLNLLKSFPQSEESFNDSRNALKKRMRTERYKFSDIFWAYLRAQRMGKKSDGKKELYESIDNYKLSDISDFFDKHVKNKPYTMIVIGSKEHIDFKTLEQFGTIKEITMDELFPRY